MGKKPEKQMTRIESEKVLINNSDKTIFSFLTNFNNFEKLMPEQIINWVSDEDSCSFTIKGMAQLGMRINQKEPYSKIVIVADGKVPFQFELICLLNFVGLEQTETQFVFIADLNPMLKMMAKAPLENFVNLLVKKLKEMFD